MERKDEWQYASMCMIFDIKHDLQRKAQVVVGDHVIDSSDYNTYSSTVKNMLVRLMMLIVVKKILG
eukprot:6995476-Ditylum_brightwellii.AAC.1